MTRWHKEGKVMESIALALQQMEIWLWVLGVYSGLSTVTWVVFLVLWRKNQCKCRSYCRELECTWNKLNSRY